jgi:YVTN family beta-propeller protein
MGKQLSGLPEEKTKKKETKMKKLVPTIIMALVVVAFSAPYLPSGTAFAAWESPLGGKIVVANRGSGTISVISTITDEVVGTYNLPAGENTPEPMYVVYTPTRHQVFVGDRANNRVVVFDARNFDVRATVEAGAGIFHMWADPQGRQLWVNNDIDNTTTVINPRTLQVIATVPTPADLVAQGGKPHDVILDPWGRYAYVSLVGLDGENDYVVKFSTRTFQEIGRAAVGKDPHLSLTRRNGLLYVPSQGNNSVFVLNRRTMELVTEIPVPGAHGAGMAHNGKYFYTTNLPGGGTDGLYTINTRTNTVVGEAVDTPYPVPHNIALTPNSHKLYVTHSGGKADKVTVYTTTTNDNTTRSEPVPVLAGEISVELNPFGLAYVP